MKENELVSIIIPTFNRPEFVIKAVESALNQSHQNIEVIVIDDASPNDIEPLLIQDGRIKVLRNLKNSGPCYSRNKGLEVAKGKYVNFLDDDDILYPEKIKKQLSVFNNSDIPNLGMVTCHAVDRRFGTEIFRYNKVKGNIYNKMIYRYTVHGTETMLFKTELVREIGGFDENLESSQEYDLLIRFTEKYNVDYVDEILTEEFESSDQISINFDKKINGAKYLYSKHNNRFKAIGKLFYLKMQLKLKVLILRFYIGKYFGVKAFNLLSR